MLCPTCGKDKPENDFYLHWKTPPKSCRDCVRAKDNARWLRRVRQNQPDRLGEVLANRERVAACKTRGATPEGMQWCGKCGAFKPLADFGGHSRTNWGWCRDCLNQYSVLRAMRLKQRAIEYLGGACGRCGFQGHFAAFDLHHIDPDRKDMGWGDKLRKTSWQGMLPELAKCRLLCRNCHAIIHSRYNDDGSPNSEYVPVN